MDLRQIYVMEREGLLEHGASNMGTVSRFHFRGSQFPRPRSAQRNKIYSSTPTF